MVTDREASNWGAVITGCILVLLTIALVVPGISLLTRMGIFLAAAGLLGLLGTTAFVTDMTGGMIHEVRV